MVFLGLVEFDVFYNALKLYIFCIELDDIKLYKA